MSDLHDDILFNVLKECKTLPNFLDCIFGFLQRRTDFYVVAETPNSPVGLPEGLAEKLVKHAFFRWKQTPELQVQNDSEIPIISEEVVISEEKKSPFASINPCISSIKDSSQEQKQESVSNDKNFSSSEYYNGARFEHYCWSQSITDVDVTVKLPENTRPKDVLVEIQPNELKVKIQNSVMLHGGLCQKCKSSEAIWSIEDKKLQIHLDKRQETWWDCLITSEDKIDLSQIDNSRPFEDLSEEAQSKIEELGWNQQRKKLNLPTSDELAKQEILRKAWIADGSPFSGPFDPSTVNLM